LYSKGVMGKYWANESVSKGMAPIGLALNTLALTGRLFPTRGELTKWTGWYIPTALFGMACTGLVVMKFGLGSLETRAVSGSMLFPFDYTAKRFFIFSRQVWLTNLIFKKLVPVALGLLLWMRLHMSVSNPKTEKA